MYVYIFVCVITYIYIHLFIYIGMGQDWNTELWQACSGGHVEVVQLLLRHGANAKIDSNVITENQFSCIDSFSVCV